MPRRPGSPGDSSHWLASSRSRTHPYTADGPFTDLGSDIQRTVLDNGLRVLTKEVYPASVVSLALWVGVGALHESDSVAGVSHFIEHMLFKGTPRRPVGRMAQEIHELGGYLNAFTSYECTCYWMVLPSRHFRTVLEIASDALLNPLFDPDESEREAAVIMDELRMYQDRPDYFCFEKLLRLAFPKHRYGRPVIGFEGTLGSMRSPELRRHYEDFYVPSNMAVTVVGDVSGEEALARVEEALGGVPSRSFRTDRPAPEPPQTEMRRLELEGDVSAAHLQLAFRLPSLFAKDAFACEMLASILGDGRSSRLSLQLRERLGLVTRVGCSTFLERDPGLLIVEATLPPENLAAAEAEIFRVLESVTQGVDRREMQKARNQAESTYVFGQETVEGQGRKLGYYEMLGDYTLADDYVRRLTAVTPSQVVEAARRYLRPERCSVVSYRPGTSS